MTTQEQIDKIREIRKGGGAIPLPVHETGCNECDYRGGEWKALLGEPLLQDFLIDGFEKDEFRAKEPRTKEELRIRLSEHIHTFGEVTPVIGALGEVDGQDNAYIESVTMPEEGGILTKFYGVTYPWKGLINDEHIDRATIAKKLFYEGIVFFRENWFLLPLFLFKGFREGIMNRLYHTYSCEGFYTKQLKIKEHCKMCRELIRVLLRLSIIHDDRSRIIFLKIVSFLEFSPAYRLRLQDLFGMISKILLNENPIREIKRIRDIALRRELGEKKKIGILFSILIIAMYVSKFRKFIVSFINEINLKEVKLDEADTYYTLRRNSYNFADMPVEERLRLVKIIDKDKGHLVLEI